MRRTKGVALLLAAVSVASVFALVWGAYDNVATEDALIERSEPVKGTVIEFVSYHRGGSAGRVNYTVGGREWKAVVDFRRIVKAGEEVSLRYDPDDPSIVFDAAHPEPVPFPMWMGLAFLAAGLSLIGASLLGVASGHGQRTTGV